MKSGSPEHEHAMVRAAELYYNDGLLQSQVADRLRVSRWKVGRLLEEARSSGMVEIRIHHPLSRRRDLEIALTDRYGCEAIVIGSLTSAEATMGIVGRATADYVCELRPEPTIIGLSWGYTVAAIASQLPDQAFTNPVIIQLNGGATSVHGTVDASSVIRMFASKSRNSHMILLPASAVVTDRRLAAGIIADRQVAATLKLASRADLAIYSLGKLTARSVLVAIHCVTDTELTSLQESGAIGDVLGHFLDAEGNIASPDIDSRTIGLSLEALRRLLRAVAVAVGEKKAEITKAALQAQLCTVLVTESVVAQRILGDVGTIKA